MRFLEALNKPVFVLALLLIMLSTFGLLYYRYQAADDTSSARVRGASAPDSVPETTARSQYEGGNTAPGGSTAPAPEADEAVFVHRATSENIVDNSTYLDHPLVNGNLDAFILVTQISEPGDNATNNDHPIGVWYDENRSGRWAIFNQDLAAMPEGAAFNVTISESSENALHRAAPRQHLGERHLSRSSLSQRQPQRRSRGYGQLEPGRRSGDLQRPSSRSGVRYQP